MVFRPVGSGPRNAFDLGELFRKDSVEVWPENWEAVSLFLRMITQWRVGMHGPTGLDYGVLLALIDRLGLDPNEADELFDDVRDIEATAINVMRDSAS